MSGRLELKLMGLSTLINLVIGVFFGLLLYIFWPSHYFKWYPTIPLFYWLSSILMIYFLNYVKRKRGDVTVLTYMVVRLCKFTLALVFLALYTILVKECMMAFGFTLMIFYFIYLSMETYTLYLFEKKRMKRERNEKDEEYIL